jgi:hypothetical protein
MDHYPYYPYYPFFRIRGSQGARGASEGLLSTKKGHFRPPLFFLRVIRVIRVNSRPGLGLSLTLLKEEWVIWVIVNPLVASFGDIDDLASR